ncbi:hypothetical protein [Embleya hyalina]|uniref:Uncharacterized protein n=1 Tax=Embleya hyalina TaxID=516124 RepID=A0A401YQS1_9ACTN|nr:hypothetical protein [Embleya hyalina]GCD96931.1 hypothetical protein EHYA_04618 [Embleya hyalina]
MTDVGTLHGAVVSMAAWSIHLNPVDGHLRPWRLAVVSAALDVPGPLERAAFHLSDTDVAVLAGTVLRPPRPEDRPPGRARVLRGGIGLRLRLFVHAIDGDRPEPRGLIHLREHHRQVLLDDIARHRRDLIPTATPPDPRLCLDPMPVIGLTIDQVAALRDRCDHWLHSEGIRAAITDRELAARVQARAADR